jgi:hypothetical protein
MRKGLQLASILLFLLPPLSDAAEREGGDQGKEDQIVFIPRADAPPGRRVDGILRAAASAPSVAIVAPHEPAGLTARERPSIYWYLSRKCTQEVWVTVRAADGSTPATRVVLPGPHEAGFHKLDWTAENATARKAQAMPPLKAEVKYTLRVTVRMADADADEASSNPTATAPIQRVTGPRTAELKDVAEPWRRVQVCASAGLWFDMLDELNLGIEKGDRRRDDLLRFRMEQLRKEGLRFKSNGEVAEPKR